MVASFQRDTEGSSIGPGLIPQPKLEKGPDIFVDVIRSFKKDEVIPFVPGWRRDFIVEQLKSKYDVVTQGKVSDDVMNKMYNIVRKRGGTCQLMHLDGILKIGMIYWLGQLHLERQRPTFRHGLKSVQAVFFFLNFQITRQKRSISKRN